MLSCQVQKKNKEQADTLRKCEKISNITTNLSIVSWIGYCSIELTSLLSTSTLIGVHMYICSFLYSSRQREGCDDAPPQIINYEEIIPLGSSTNPKADTAPTSHEPLSLQLVNNVAYWHVHKTDHCMEMDPTRKNQAVPSEAYAQKSKPRGPWWQGICFSWSK